MKYKKLDEVEFLWQGYVLEGRIVKVETTLFGNKKYLIQEWMPNSKRYNSTWSIKEKNIIKLKKNN